MLLDRNSSGYRDRPAPCCWRIEVIPAWCRRSAHAVAPTLVASQALDRPHYGTPSDPAWIDAPVHRRRHRRQSARANHPRAAHLGDCVDIVQDAKDAEILLEFGASVERRLGGRVTNTRMDLALRLRAKTRPGPIPVPMIVYGYGLSAADTERAATIGALWLQLVPTDGTKLAAATRGVLTAAGITLPQSKSSCRRWPPRAWRMF